VTVQFKKINLKKATWITCVLVRQPVVTEREPFKDLSYKLPRDQDIQACWAEGKLHAQAHTGSVQYYGSASAALLHAILCVFLWFSLEFSRRIPG
jgi:hypothetical protein